MSITRPWSTRYLLARVSNAIEAVIKDASTGAGTAAGAGAEQGLLQRLQAAYKQPMTSVMAITGAAMQPALNAGLGEDNQGAYEKLVIRHIPRPSPRTIGVGDVVAFNSPLDPSSEHSIMVRRVAALEGQVMLSSEDEEFAERVPQGHCWVMADNEQLAPPDVIDSRVFGYLDTRLIIGRAIFRVQDSQHCGPVANSPQSEGADAAVIDSEVDAAALAAGMPGELQRQEAATKQQQEPEQQQQRREQHDEQ